MAQFGQGGNGEEEGGFRFEEVDFGLRNAEKLVPLPATQAVQEQQGPRRFTQPKFNGPPPPQNVQGPQRFTTPQFPAPQGPTTAPGLPSMGSAPVGFGNNPVNAQDFNASGNAALDAFRAQMRTQFPLGGSDLSNPEVQNQAAAAFQNYITQAGGSPNLRAEIGDARFVNRLQEFLGKGDTLNQSGRINVGNGVVIDSLRGLGDFNQPGGGGSFGGGSFGAGGFDANSFGGGGFGGGGFSSRGQLVEGTGKGHPGVPAKYVGGRRGGGRSVGSQVLREIAQGSGIDEEILFSVEKNLRESLEREFSAGADVVEEMALSRGMSQGGSELGAIADLRQNLSEDMSGRLRDVAISMGLDAQNRRLTAAQALQYEDLQREAMSIQRIGQEMDFFLGNQGQQMNFALGQGGLALQKLSINTTFAAAMRGMNIDAAGLAATIQLAIMGQDGAAVNALLGIADQLNGGWV